MRVAWVGAGSRVPDQGRRAGWSGQRGERPQPGQDLGEQLVPVPMLCRGGLVRRGHVQAGQDEGVAVDVSALLNQLPELRKWRWRVLHIAHPDDRGRLASLSDHRDLRINSLGPFRNRKSVGLFD
jgi:hypothetical protein